MSDLKNKELNVEDNGCGCGHDHDHDHDHDHHVHTLTLELENGEELVCPIIEIFEVEGKEYIALLHPEEEIAMLYGFIDDEDGSVELTEITDDDEYDKIAEVFNELVGAEDDEDEEEA